MRAWLGRLLICAVTAVKIWTMSAVTEIEPTDDDLVAEIVRAGERQARPRNRHATRSPGCTTATRRA